jgi:RNA recognition motif-containing protein
MIKLYISNLDYTANASCLHREFEALGRVTLLFLATELGAMQHKGFGFVTFADQASAEEAISKMGQSKLDGRMLRVNELKPRGERPANIGRGGRRRRSGGEKEGGRILGPNGFEAFNPQ